MSDDSPSNVVRAAPGIEPGRWVAFWTEQVDLIVQQEWRALELRFAEDFVFESFLSGLRASLTGREAYINNLRQVTERQVASEVEIIEVRGRSLCLSHMRVFGPGDANAGPWELTPRLTLIRAEDDHRLSLMEVFEVDDLDVARRRLRELAEARQ